jgi:hypothetical protein
MPVVAVSFDLNSFPKGTRYNEVAPGTRPGASYKEWTLVHGLHAGRNSNVAAIYN